MEYVTKSSQHPYNPHFRSKKTASESLESFSKVTQWVPTSRCKSKKLTFRSLSFNVSICRCVFICMTPDEMYGMICDILTMGVMWSRDGNVNVGKRKKRLGVGVGRSALHSQTNVKDTGLKLNQSLVPQLILYQLICCLLQISKRNKGMHHFPNFFLVRKHFFLMPC